MKWERARCARQVMREVDMERQARGIALGCGPWGLSLFCAPWAKFARVAVRENSSRVHVPAIWYCISSSSSFHHRPPRWYLGTIKLRHAARSTHEVQICSLKQRQELTFATRFFPSGNGFTTRFFLRMSNGRSYPRRAFRKCLDLSGTPPSGLRGLRYGRS